MTPLQILCSRLGFLGSLFLALCAFGAAQSMAAEPAGRAVLAWHVTISPGWVGPSGAAAQITPFGIPYPIHEALGPPHPAEKLGPRLAQSWHAGGDSSTYNITI